MPKRLTTAAVLLSLLASAAPAQEDELHERMDRLEAEIERAEDVRAIKRLQRAYGYYLDKGMWSDLAELFADDAVANYPAGVYVGKESIRRHLFMNVGGGEMGENGLGDNRLYNHMNIQPVVHLGPGGETAAGRWRAFAMFGSQGGGAIWAEGVYEFDYVKDGGVWKIRTLDYHSGFGAPYQTGWVAPEGGGGGGGGPRNLPHPADRERDMCGGFPEACLAPFHYENPGTGNGGHLWADSGAGSRQYPRGDAADRAAELARRADRLSDERQIENLQRIYGYYFDRRLWGQVADLFADDGTIELGQRGVYEGRERVREFLELLGPEGLSDGELNDHVMLQTIVTVAPDGRTARMRGRELAMTGEFESHGEWSEGVYENSFVKADGVWKIESLRYYPTFITDYEEGWARDAEQPAGPSDELPPDRPPTDRYEIFPRAHIPPYHYDNPVTGESPQYPTGEGRPSRAAIRAVRAGVPAPMPARRLEGERNVEAVVAEAERGAARYKDYHELENLTNAYGYYLDKNLWNDLADLFAEAGSMELAQRGVYEGRDRVRGFLLAVFGRGGVEGPVAGRLGNHLQMQPVIHVAPDGQSAQIRSRMMQQLSFGERASLGAAIYENAAVKEDGVWKLSRVHAYNTWTAGYEGGWANDPGRFVPGPSEDYPPDAPPTLEFEMFPNVYDVPFHYRNPVSGRPAYAYVDGDAAWSANLPPRNVTMPLAIERELRDIGAAIEGQRTTAAYAPIQPAEPYHGVAVTRDARYGPHERNVLDVFTSPEPGRNKPVVVFVHGGGFSRGAKRTPGSPFYDNLMLWAEANGLVGVNVNYRLAPEHQWPSGIEDLTSVVDWIGANIERYGGAPGRVFLWGHSAGAAHVADYIAAAVKEGREDGLAGAILTSGFYELGDEVSIWEAYYGDDVSTYAERSSLDGLVATNTPLLVNDAELDPPSFREQAQLLVDALDEAGKPPAAYVHLLGHSHLSETYALGTSDTSLSAPVLAFVRGR